MIKWCRKRKNTNQPILVMNPKRKKASRTAKSNLHHLRATKRNKSSNRKKKLKKSLRKKLN